MELRTSGACTHCPYEYGRSANKSRLSHLASLCSPAVALGSGPNFDPNPGRGGPFTSTEYVATHVDWSAHDRAFTP